jgi:FHA domain protein
MSETPKLIVLSEQFRGKVFELTKDLHTAGRVDARDICIKDPSISSYHADFIKKGATYILRDRNSTNGSKVNNVPVTEDVELKSSDMIQLGNVEMLYDCQEKSSTRELKTMTKIDITSTSTVGTSTLQRLETVSQGRSQKKSWVPIVIIALLGLLTLLIIAGIAFVVILLSKK